eukprot:GHVP01069579.1.p1 GENE.GHVP01069579.1~~GHVP01069579.1.p1  ORF type:complete len:663 (+),score=127.45 GHVP01069579.1:1789-3777(+)
MGIPMFFRWIVEKYPKTVTPVKEEKVEIETFFKKDNPNGMEIDNLYIDMNGIVHNCSHPEGRKQPETTKEIFKKVTKYLDRIMEIVRPRKVLFIGIDGVAPRAKMNQQRSRRFLSARTETDNDESKTWFDPNCITPGTHFMEELTIYLQDYLQTAVKENILYTRPVIILSDSSIPGEGEHKIMEFIRNQRAKPEYEPNTRHVLYGLDADLIMLGLTTHEPLFHLLREDVIRDSKRKYFICGKCHKKGHYSDECGREDDAEPFFIFFHIGVLREYLKVEFDGMKMDMEQDFERTLDDWIFMCFLIGNDFLPHMMSLEVKENAVDRFVFVYKKTVRKYITRKGEIHLDRMWVFFEELSKAESNIFKNRKRKEDHFSQKRKERNPDEPVLELDDPVRLHEDGYKSRYYIDKVGNDNEETIKDMVSNYIDGLVWMMRYYYKGCPSWRWFYPYHYAPFLSDIFTYGKSTPIEFKTTRPFRPFEQLMGVLPPASQTLLPVPFRELFSSEESKIKHFYPTEFRLDLNGKKVPWLAVANLPFIEENVFLSSVRMKYFDLSDEEKNRNKLGEVYIYSKNEETLSGYSDEIKDTGGSLKYIYDIKQVETIVQGTLKGAIFDKDILTSQDIEKLRTKNSKGDFYFERDTWVRKRQFGDNSNEEERKKKREPKR